mgnify:CR=1 FL=1
MDKLEIEMLKTKIMFEKMEKLMKEKLRKENNIEDIENYFVDGANNIASKYNIYKILNKNNEVIYIGLTTNHRNRVKGTHLYKAGHLPDKCYEEMDNIQIAPVNNRDEMKIYERYLINLLNPKYNVKMKNNNNFRFKLPNLKWYDYSKYTLTFK